MAETNNAQAWVNPDAWLTELTDELSEEYMVVADAEVQRVTLSAVVVGPQGLVVLHGRDWEGQIEPAVSGRWRRFTPAGEVLSMANPLEALRPAKRALLRFLRDEFPRLHPTIVQLVVLTHPRATISERMSVTNIPLLQSNELAREVIAQFAAMGEKKLDQAVCEELAQALTERKLSRTQRAAKPFVFRSGSLLGGNHKAWNLQQLFKYLESHPADGIYHMRNGTLETWLREQGALHLAKLVRAESSEIGRDPRAALEKLLAKSGLVSRRSISMRPARINFGRVLSGAECGATIRVRSHALHGYVVGNLETSEPWLRVDPNLVSGHKTDVAVRADTARLPIQAKPYSARVQLVSDLLDKPLDVAVRVRVVSEPSRLVRVVFRPLFGALVAAAGGALLGFLLARQGIAPPAFIRGLVPGWPAELIWAIIIGLFWMFWGIIKGFQQPVTHPLVSWLLRWLVGILLWMIPLGLIALAAVWMLNQLYATSAWMTPQIRTSILVGSLSLAVIPAVMDRGRRAAGGERRGVDTLDSRRPLMVTLVAIILVLVSFAGVLYLPAAWKTAELQAGMATAQGWISSQYLELKTSIDTWIEDYYIRRYDRRAKQ